MPGGISRFKRANGITCTQRCCCERSLAAPGSAESRSCTRLACSRHCRCLHCPPADAAPPCVVGRRKLCGLNSVKQTEEQMTATLDKRKAPSKDKVMNQPSHGRRDCIARNALWPLVQAAHARVRVSFLITPGGSEHRHKSISFVLRVCKPEIALPSSMHHPTSSRGRRVLWKEFLSETDWDPCSSCKTDCTHRRCCFRAVPTGVGVDRCLLASLTAGICCEAACRCIVRAVLSSPDRSLGAP